MQGQVRSFHRESNGYRVELDRGGYSYFVPDRYVRNRRDFRVGVSIRLGGVFRGGSIYVDSCDFPSGGGYYDQYDGYGYGDGYYGRSVSGYVERIDFRSDSLVLRDERTGRWVTVDMRRADRRSRSIDLNDLRRGDYIELSGNWRGNVFAASRVDGVSSGGRGRYGRRY